MPIVSNARRTEKPSDLPSEWVRNIIVPVFLVVTTSLFALVVFPPIWETNDDVGMSMLAHGYGIIAEPTPKLIFSNVLWGYFAQALDFLPWIKGYSLASQLMQTAACCALVVGLIRLDLPLCGVASLGVMLFFPTLLMPQFSLLAGFLALASIVSVRAWALHPREALPLILAAVLMFFALLVRAQQAILMLLIFLPLAPWKAMFKTRGAHAIIAGGLLVLVMATAFDHLAYSSDGWVLFDSMNVARAPYTDFAAASQLLERPDILKQYRFSENDLRLVESWFFVDPQLANPIALNSMAAELEVSSLLDGAATRVFVAMQALYSPRVLPLTLVGLFTIALRPSLKAAICWMLALLVFCGLGILGRPGIVRIYIPVMALLVIAPLLVPQKILRPMHSYWITAGFLVTAIVTTLNATKVHAMRLKQSDTYQQAFLDMPEEMIFVWGASLPYQLIYPVVGEQPQQSIYALGGFTLAPVSTSVQAERNGMGFLSQLSSHKGVPLLASKYSASLLGRYCEQRLNTTMSTVNTEDFGALNITWYSCISSSSSLDPLYSDNQLTQSQLQ